MAVPFGLAAMFLALGGLGLVICFTAGIRQTPSPVHLACMILMALFLCVLGATFLKIGSNGFIKEIVFSESGLMVKKLWKSEEFQWTELNRIASTDTGLNLRMASGAEIDVSPSLEGFHELTIMVKERYKELKGFKPIPPRKTP